MVGERLPAAPAPLLPGRSATILHLPQSGALRSGILEGGYASCKWGHQDSGLLLIVWSPSQLVPHCEIQQAGLDGFFGLIRWGSCGAALGNTCACAAPLIVPHAAKQGVSFTCSGCCSPVWHQGALCHHWCFLAVNKASWRAPPQPNMELISYILDDGYC